MQGDILAIVHKYFIKGVSGLFGIFKKVGRSVIKFFLERQTTDITVEC